MMAKEICLQHSLDPASSSQEAVSKEKDKLRIVSISFFYTLINIKDQLLYVNYLLHVCVINDSIYWMIINNDHIIFVVIN